MWTETAENRVLVDYKVFTQMNC